MHKFRVAITGDLLDERAAPILPEVDLTRFDQDPLIEYTRLLSEPGHLIQASQLDDLDAIVVASERMDDTSFNKSGRLSLIAFFGVGYDQLDVDAASRNGVALTITPDAVRHPVAVGTLTLILAVSTNLTKLDKFARQGAAGWARAGTVRGVGLAGKTLGILGLGNIGGELVGLVSPLQMKVIAHDPFVDLQVASKRGVDLVGLDDLLSVSDVLVVSCPLNSETHGLLDAARLSLMRPSAYLINTARGAIVDQDALADALSQGRIAGAGLDVFAQEPESLDHRLMALDNVTLSPHCIALTDQCVRAIWDASEKAVRDVMSGREPNNIVNRDALGSGDWYRKLANYGAIFAGS